MTDKKSFVNLEHARTEDQRKLMEKIKTDGVCPFCPEHLVNYHPKPILRKGTYWSLTENMSPYEHTRVHLLAIHNDHVISIAELPKESWVELREHILWATQTYNLTSGAFLMRFGETTSTGASVDHLHAHLITKDLTKNETLRVKIG